MEILKLVILSIVSFVVLFLLTKVMGFRQISQLSFFDYVIGISIGSIAAEMATNVDMEWWKGVLAMAIYAVFDTAFAFLSQKSILARKLISGKPIILIDKGQIIKKNVKKARIDLDDLLTSARGAGYFNISDVDYAIMETTGSISFQPTPQKRPLNPKDFNFAPMRDGLCVNVVIDGKIMEDNLKNAHVTRLDLEKMFSTRQKQISQTLLATIDINGMLDIFDK